MTKF
jgi:hypothetical protein